MKLPWQKPKVRSGQGSTVLSRDEFERRWKQQFYDPAFEKAQSEIDLLAGIAWEAYNDHRKSPRTRKAGPEFADPEHELAIEWLETRRQIRAAEKNKRSTMAIRKSFWSALPHALMKRVRVKCQRHFGSRRCCANSLNKPAGSRWIF